MNNFINSTLLISTLITLQACAGPGGFSPAAKNSDGGATPTASDAQVERIKLGKPTIRPLLLIAEDFLRALAQVPELSAESTAIRSKSVKSGFETALIQGLQKRGYKIVNEVQAQDSSSIQTTTVANPSNATEFTFTFELKHLALKRSYIIDGNYVRPASSLFVRGVSPDSIRLDDRLFVERFYR